LSQIRPVVGLPTLTWLRAFEAAARTSSFTAAAAESGLILVEVNLGDAPGDARFAVAKKLALKASGLALSLRPGGS